MMLSRETIIHISFSLFIFVSFGVNCQNTTAPEDDEDPMYSDPRCLPGCFFEYNILETKSLKLFPTNCSTVCAPHGLHIGIETDLTDKQLNTTLKNMKNLIGSLYISRTSFKSAKFLSNLETVDCYNIGTFQVSMNSKMTEAELTSLTNVSCMIDISGNLLYRLGMPKMIPAPSPVANHSQLSIEFYGNSEDFCVTVQEMTNFMTYDDTLIDRFDRSVGTYCEISNTSTFPQKTCDIGKIGLKNLDTGCVNLRGDLLIGPGEENFTQKLESVEVVFGRLQITRTNLTNTNFLAKLTKVMSITKDKPTIQIDFNTLLTNATFPSLKRILSTVINPVIFNNNSQELLKSSSFCYGIMNNVAKGQPWKVKFDGNVCDDVEKAIVKDKSSRNGFLGLFLLVGVIFGMTLF